MLVWEAAPVAISYDFSCQTSNLPALTLMLCILVLLRTILVSAIRTRLVCQDALAFVDQNQAKFDVVIDDLYSDALRDGPRTSRVGLHLRFHCAADGLLIKNHLDSVQQNEYAQHQGTIKRTFTNGLNFSTGGTAI